MMSPGATGNEPFCLIRYGSPMCPLLAGNGRILTRVDRLLTFRKTRQGTRSYLCATLNMLLSSQKPEMSAAAHVSLGNLSSIFTRSSFSSLGLSASHQRHPVLSRHKVAISLIRGNVFMSKWKPVATCTEVLASIGVRGTLMWPFTCHLLPYGFKTPRTGICTCSFVQI